MRYGFKTAPIRYRDFGMVGISFKLPIQTNDTLRVLSNRYGGIPKAHLIQALVVDWVEKMSKEIGESVLQRWARETEEALKATPWKLKDLEYGLEMLAGTRNPRSLRRVRRMWRRKG